MDTKYMIQARLTFIFFPSLFKINLNIFMGPKYIVAPGHGDYCAWWIC